MGSKGLPLNYPAILRGNEECGERLREGEGAGREGQGKECWGIPSLHISRCCLHHQE